MIREPEPVFMDKFLVMMTVITDAGSTFVVGLENIEAPNDVEACQRAIKIALERGVKVCVVVGTPPLAIKPVCAVPFHTVKTNAVSLVGG